MTQQQYKKASLPSGEYLLVRVPEKYEDFKLANGWVWAFKHPGMSVRSRIVELPPGNYTLIGLGSEISEEQWSRIIESRKGSIVVTKDWWAI